MGYRNGAYSAQAHGLPMGARIRAWLLVVTAFAAAFVLAVAIAALVPDGLAYADNEPAAGTPATADADAGGNAANTGDGTADAGDSGSVSGSDISLTPTDSGELASEETAAKGDESEPAETITVTIVSRSGQALQSFQIIKGKTISFIDNNEEVLVQYVADTTSVVEPVAPEKSGYDFNGWSVKINDEGNAVISPQYKEKSSDSGTTDDVKASRSVSGTVTTNSPKTGDLLTLAVPIVIAGVALLTIVALLFARRRS